MRLRTVIIYNILFLCFLFFSIALVFSFIYMLLDFLNIGHIIDHYSSSIHQQQLMDLFTRSLYFSFITLFSVGYGDMTPFGFSKGVAIVEATIGYVLPIAIVVRYILFTPKSIRNIQPKENLRKQSK